MRFECGSGLCIFLNSIYGESSRSRLAGVFEYLYLFHVARILFQPQRAQHQPVL